MMRRAVIAAAALAGAWGCARMQPGLGFDEVRHGVEERAGARVQWLTGSPEDQEARDLVASLLREELTAGSAAQIALLNNRELQAVYEELNLAQADVVRAGRLANPVLGVEARFAEGGGGTAWAIDVGQNFLSLLDMPLRRGRAEAAFEGAKLRVTGAVLELAARVRRAFFEYQAAEQMREMRTAAVEATDASYELAKRLRAAGNNRELDVLTERVVYEEARVALALAEADVEQRREELNALMGLWGPATAWRAAGRLPALPESGDVGEDIERRAVAASLDLAAARREVEVAARTLGMTRPGAWLGELEVGAAAEREAEGGWTIGPALAVPIPLLDQGQAASGEARARLNQAAARYFARAVEVRARARAARAAALAAYERARYYERVILPLRERVVGETLLQYNAMEASPFQLLQAKRDQVEAGAAYIGALRDYWVARTAADLIRSGRLPGDGMFISGLTSSPPGAIAGGGEH